jgi:hypothetical protein
MRMAADAVLDEDLACLKCGGALSTAEPARPQLKLKPRPVPPEPAPAPSLPIELGFEVSEEPDPPSEAASDEPAEEASEEEADIYAAQRRIGDDAPDLPRPRWTWVGKLLRGLATWGLLSGALVALQLRARTDPDAVWWYLVLCYAAASLVYFSAVCRAFSDHLLKGMLILLVPGCSWLAFMLIMKEVTLLTMVLWAFIVAAWCYIPFYIFFGTRSAVIKGLFAAVVLAVCLEPVLVADRSVVRHAARAFSQGKGFLEQTI